MPAKIALAFQTLQHQLLHHMPTRRKLQYIDAQTAVGPQFSFLNCRTVKPVVERDDQWLHSIFPHQGIERIGAVLAAAERHDAVIVALAAVTVQQGMQFFFPGCPVDFFLFVLLLPADIANAFLIKKNRFMRFRRYTTRT